MESPEVQNLEPILTDQAPVTLNIIQTGDNYALVCGQEIVIVLYPKPKPTYYSRR